MKKLLVDILPNGVRKFCSNIINSLDYQFIRSYSQEGEDMVLRAIFHGRERGFYIDVGAHHPKIFSNTYHFYQRGWNGINIDAMPGSMSLFKNIRGRDINVEAAVAEKKQVMTFYTFNEPALNTFSEALALERSRIEKFRVVSEQQIETVALGELLDRFMPHGQQHIDFMSVDVEGLDLDVLRSNNWEKYRPTIILVESLEFSLDSKQKDPIVTFLNAQNYRLFSKTVNTLFFADETFKYNTY